MFFECHLLMRLTFVLYLTCGFCLVLPLPKMLHGSNWPSEGHHLQDTNEMDLQKLPRYSQLEVNKYQQQRRRLQRQLSQQPAGHCFQVWDDPSSTFKEEDLNNICSSENWSLLDFTKRKQTPSFSSSGDLSRIDSEFFRQSADANQKHLSSGPQRRLANHRWQNHQPLSHENDNEGAFRLTRRSGKETTCFRRWMTLLNRRLSNARLGDLVIPGTHNSASYSVSSNGTLVEKLWISRLALSLGFSDYFSSWARNHDGGLLAQLNAGYRCLDLRITVLPNGRFYWWHGISGEAIDAGLKDIADFARKNPAEVIILLISHLNAPGEGAQEKLPMPHQSKIKLGQHLLSILGPTLVPTYNISLNPTLSSVLATGRNVITLIREDQDLVNAFSQYFWSDVNNQTAVEMFERKTNPRSMFRHRCNIMQKYKQDYSDRMSITPAFVTHNVPNILGGILRSTRVAWVLSLLLIYIFYLLAKWWDQQRTPLSIFFFHLGLRNVASTKRRWRMRRYPAKLVRVTVVYVGVITLSVSLGYLQQRTILSLFGFEGKATNLLEMARIANLCGDDPSHSINDVMYKSINSMIRHWSDRDHEYRLNIVLVDDFSSSQVVRTAIQENIRRTDKTVFVYNANQPKSQQQRLLNPNIQNDFLDNDVKISKSNYKISKISR